MRSQWEICKNLPKLKIFCTISNNLSIAYVKFIYSEKATKFCEISTLDLPYVVPVKSTLEISQNFVAFLEYMKFTMKMYELMGYLAFIANMF